MSARSKRILFVFSLTLYLVLSLLLLPSAKAADNQRYTVTLDQLSNSIKEALLEQGVEDNLEVTITNRFNDYTLEGTQAPTLKVESLKTNSKLNRFSAEIRLNPQQLVSIAGRYERILEIPSVKQRVFRDEVIQEKDIAWIPVAESKIRKETLLDPNDIIGKSPRRTLLPNQVIDRGFLVTPMIIQRNQMVSVLYETPTIHLTIKGQALDNGGRGEMIRVKNPTSGKIIYASVESENQLRIPTNSDAELTIIGSAK